MTHPSSGSWEEAGLLKHLGLQRPGSPPWGCWGAGMCVTKSRGGTLPLQGPRGGDKEWGCSGAGPRGTLAGRHGPCEPQRRPQKPLKAVSTSSGSCPLVLGADGMGTRRRATRRTGACLPGPFHCWHFPSEGGSGSAQRGQGPRECPADLGRDPVPHRWPACC